MATAFQADAVCSRTLRRAPTAKRVPHRLQERQLQGASGKKYTPGWAAHHVGVGRRPHYRGVLLPQVQLHLVLRQHACATDGMRVHKKLKPYKAQLRWGSALGFGRALRCASCAGSCANVTRLVGRRSMLHIRSRLPLCRGMQTGRGAGAKEQSGHQGNLQAQTLHQMIWEISWMTSAIRSSSPTCVRHAMMLQMLRQGAARLIGSGVSRIELLQGLSTLAQMGLLARSVGCMNGGVQGVAERRAPGQVCTEERRADQAVVCGAHSQSLKPVPFQKVLHRDPASSTIAYGPLLN